MIQLSTTQELEAGRVVTRMFPMIVATRKIEVSKKGVVRSLLTWGRDEMREAFDAFTHMAPKEATAVIGVHVSTTAQEFKNGTFLYVTIAGTPVVVTDEGAK